MTEKTKKEIKNILKEKHYIVYDNFAICNKKVFEGLLYNDFLTKEKIDTILTILKEIIIK